MDDTWMSEEMGRALWLPNILPTNPWCLSLLGIFLDFGRGEEHWKNLSQCLISFQLSDWSKCDVLRHLVRKKGKAALWDLKARRGQGPGSERSLRSGGSCEGKSTLYWGSPDKSFFQFFHPWEDLLETSPCLHLQESNFIEENTFSKLKQDLSHR